jgi:hypothetical protein
LHHCNEYSTDAVLEPGVHGEDLVAKVFDDELAFFDEF